MSALYKFSDNLSARMGFGTGYKIPTVFTADAEENAYKNILPVSPDMKAENSQGFNLDVSYKFVMDEFLFSLNQARSFI